MRFAAGSKVSSALVMPPLCIALLCCMLFCSGAYSETSGKLTDVRDGKAYKTVTVGKKVWMAENLTYADGPGSSCFEENSANCEKFGRLYTQEAAMKACPAGWHLPTKQEFELLVKSAGATGRKAFTGLVEGGASGFNALYAGWREKTGRYGYMGSSASFWSATKNTPENSWYLDLSATGRETGIFSFNAGSAFSVRCVKD